MASVIASANRSTASLFDTVTDLTTATSQLINTAARAIDMLDVKAKSMHQGIVENTIIDMATEQAIKIQERAADLTDRMEQIHRRTNQTGTFNRNEIFNSNVLKITQALTANQK